MTLKEYIGEAVAEFDDAARKIGLRLRVDKDPSPLRGEVEALLAAEIKAGFIGCSRCGESWIWHRDDVCPMLETADGEDVILLTEEMIENVGCGAD